MSRQAKYEAHITFPREEAEEVRAYATISRWTFSQIDGDPVLGRGVWCYLTSSDESYRPLKDALSKAVDSVRIYGMHPVRQKIEDVLFDVRMT